MKTPTAGAVGAGTMRDDATQHTYSVTDALNIDALHEGNARASAEKKPTASEFLSLLPSAGNADYDFDHNIYLSIYKDLDGVATEAAARQHYIDYGCREGRISTRNELAARFEALQARFGSLPDGFAWREYVDTYTDLAFIQSSYVAAEHFLQFGRREGRYHLRFQPDVYRSLYFQNAVISDDQLFEHYLTVGRPAGRIASVREIANLAGVTEIFWLEVMKVDEFNLLNSNWAGPITDKQQALRAMLREGFDRLAPICFAHEFDPTYYLEANPHLAAMSPPELYRDFLFRGLRAGRAGTAADHLNRKGLTLDHFPTAFDWKAYGRALNLGDQSCWDALDHLIANTSLLASDIPVCGAESSLFLASVANALAESDRNRSDALFECAALTGELSSADCAIWAGVKTERGLWADALRLYRVAITSDPTQASVTIAAARAALHIGDHQVALDVLWEGKAAASGDIRWRTTLTEAIQLGFSLSCQKADALDALGRREEADEVLRSVAAKVETWWKTFDPLGVVLDQNETSRVAMLAHADDPRCTFYRVAQKKELFEELGIQLEVFTHREVDEFLTNLPGAQAAIFCRLTAEPLTIRAMTVAHSLGIPTFYDADDLTFDAAHGPEPSESAGRAGTLDAPSSPAGRISLRRAAMALCDYGIASTTQLASVMEPIVRRNSAFVLPNGLDSRLRSLLDFPLPRVRRNDDIVLFCGSASKAHNSAIVELIGRPLLSLMRKFDKVRLVTVGHLTLDGDFDAVRDRIVQLTWTSNMKAYWSLLAESDINVAVLPPGPAMNCKSETQWLEAALLGVPSVVSRTERYDEVLVDGKEALIAGSPEEWLTAMEKLVASRELRAQLVRQSQAKITQHYSIGANAAKVADMLAIARKTSRSSTAKRPKKRLLLVNIFFPPQTVGGSTRVARDNLDAFLDSGFASECEFAVVTSDSGNETPLRMRVENYRGVAVFRVSTPVELKMEWDYENRSVAAMFRRVVDLWQPDLVQLHSIQRFTASVCEVCLAAGIPYISTIHDGWWTSDYMFLTDEKGRTREPDEPMPLDPPYGVSVGESLERRRRLKVLLNASADILVVSPSFTKIMVEAGFTRARSVPNGLPAMKPVTRVPSPAGLVRVAQISGFAHHKGFHLVQAAFKQGRFENLELTLLDHRRFGGRVDHTVWGASKVRLVGKTRQEEMHTFYASQDVLLAPSVWPESFGLVSREAVAAGLWVVASDRGAIGEDIEQGVNGWVIDVATLEPLFKVLAEINADPPRFLQSPPRATSPARTAMDQAHDLIEIYRDHFSGSKAVARANSGRT